MAAVGAEAGPAIGLAEARVSLPVLLSKAQRYSERWLDFAGRSGSHRWVLAVAVLLVLPCIAIGFAADDAMLRVRAGADGGFAGFEPTRWDLFVFVRDDPAQREALMERGCLSWWTAQSYRLGFMRPLSSITHALDFALWPTRPLLMYLHSIAWFVAMLVAAHAVFRRLLPGPAAIAALVFYALDDARGPVVGYISNRNALVMATFGFAAFALYDRWRRDGWRHGAWAAPTVYACSLLAGEGTVAMLGYLCAHGLLLERTSWSTRVRALAPFFALTILWAIAYRGLGYGSWGSGIYTDPGAQTWEFLSVAPGRILALFGAQWFGPWSDFWLVYPTGIAFVVAAIYAVTVIGVLWLVRRTLRDRPEAGVLLLGAALACVPLASTFPADRLLGFVGLGSAAVLGLVVNRWCEDRRAGRCWSGSTRLAVWTLVLVHAVVGPLLLPVRVRSMVTVREALATLDRVVPRDASITDREVIVAFAPNDGPSSYLTVTRVADGVPSPRAARVLATSTGAVAFTRPAATTLRVTAVDGLLTTPLERMLRASELRFRVGEQVPLGGTYSGAHARIEAITPDGRPAQVLFVFPETLESPRYVWRAWQQSGFAEWTPPAIGETIELAGFDLAHAAAVALGADP